MEHELTRVGAAGRPQLPFLCPDSFSRPLTIGFRLSFATNRTPTVSFGNSTICVILKHLKCGSKFPESVQFSAVKRSVALSTFRAIENTRGHNKVTKFQKFR